jgi:formamidopyrimidine-DNA glycosylase
VLLKAIRRILGRAIRAGGTTISNFADCEGQSGLFAVQLKVYGRAGEPCPTCQTPIERLVMAGRSTFYCPRCQIQELYGQR